MSKNNVTVLMSTFNGDRYLREQIDSILEQEDVNVNLIVRDDGSTDNTISVLNDYSTRDLLRWYSGENLGTANSFFDLLKSSPESDYYAFSDQDDVWKKEKLKKAISEMKKLNNESPILYTANYTLVDRNLKKINLNINHVTTTTFANSIVCSCCTGCTMVFNKKLRDLIRKYKKPQKVYMHDDWIHKVCLAVGGKVIFDKSPVLFYRQHGDNVDGGIHSFHDKLYKVMTDRKNNDGLMSSQFKDLLNIYGEMMTNENKELLIKALREGKGNFMKRMLLAFNKKLRIKSNVKLNNEFRISLLLNYW